MPTTGKDQSGDVSLYFHIPFCSKKCPYCHFFVLPDQDQLKKPFVAALLQEWRLRLPQLQGKRIVSIYFGGGTPTKLLPDAYASLLQEIRKSVDLASDCEITLEANPEDVEGERMKGYASAGINRVSIGLQTLQEGELLTLGRGHSKQRAMESVVTVSESGISNISIDLMFELPGQTLASWKRTLEQIATLPISHLSLYNLTIEPHTLFFKQRRELEPQLPSSDERLAMLQHAIDFLPTIGLGRYEISAFSRPGKHSRHNSGYWTGRPFLGFGPSAFSFWEGERFSNAAHYGTYLNSLAGDQLPVTFSEKLTYPHDVQEKLAVELRLCAGVDLEAFAKRWGNLPDTTLSACAALVAKGWLEKEGNVLRLTPEGQLFYDSVAVELI